MSNVEKLHSDRSQVPEHRALANSLHEYVTNLVSIKHRDANLAAVLQQLLLDACQGNNQYSC